MTRLALAYADWPEDWQRRWEAAIASSPDPFGNDGACAHWSADTRREIRKRLGMYFGYLARSGRIAPDLPLEALVGESHLRGYVGELAARVAPVTLSGYLRDLRIGLLALMTDADLSTLERVARRLGRRARPTRDKTMPGLSPAKLFDAGLARMKRVDRATYEKEDVRALQHGDGLAMAVVAATALRLKNLVGIRLGHELRLIDGVYRLDFPAAAMKGRRPFSTELPHLMNSYLDHHIARHRAQLLQGRADDHLFISAYRGPMRNNTMYERFRRATRAELGQAISPHRARDLATTWIATEHPDRIGLAPTLLNHSSRRTTLAHYNQADQISAGRTFTGTIEELRREALAALRDGDLFTREPEG